MNAITSEQKKQCVRFASDAAEKAAEQTVDELTGSGITSRQFQKRVIKKDAELKSWITERVKEKLQAMAIIVTGFTKLISLGVELILDATDGKETLADANDVFHCIDPDFKTWGTDIPGSRTGPTKVEVRELIKDGTFSGLFNGFGRRVNELCLTQAQIKSFVKNHRDWLRTDGYATFFLFKVGERYFVVYVYLFSGGSLEVVVLRFSHGTVWLAKYRHRVVVPQLALES